MTDPTAKAVCDSVSNDGVRIVSIEVTYPYAMHAEFVSYRDLVVTRSIAEPGADNVVPIRPELAPIKALVTATEWAVFLKRERNKDSPCHALASAVSDALMLSIPGIADPGVQHLPYLDDADFEAVARFVASHEGKDGVKLALANIVLSKISAARCARVSPLHYSGRRPTVTQDLALFNVLIDADTPEAGEHVARPDRIVDTRVSPTDPVTMQWETLAGHGRYIGWLPYSLDLPRRSTHGNLVNNRTLAERNKSNG